MNSWEPSVVATMFSPIRRLQRLLDFEAALARALAHTGVITSQMSQAIGAQCDASLFDAAQISREASSAGNEAIPIVEHLRIIVARGDADAASYVHWGATSQDAIDTAFVLQLRDVLAVFDEELARLTRILADLARRHAVTPIVGRTWMQHASPTTFGLKVAGWLDAVHRHRDRFESLRERALALQFGGAVGTLAALGADGPAVAAALATDLRLMLPAVPWHTTRDRVAEVATTMGLLTGTLGKIARDVSLLAQSEIDEVRERVAPGRGRSSTMPNKQNPVGCASVLTAAMRVPGLVSTALSSMLQEHERGLGGWQVEWETIPQICILAFGALTQTTDVLDGLDVNRRRMAVNMEITNGAIFAEAATFALARHVARSTATDLVTRAIRRAAEQTRHLRDVLIDDPEVGAHLSRAEVERVFDARHYLGAAEAMTRQVAALALGEQRGERIDDAGAPERP